MVQIWTALPYWELLDLYVLELKEYRHNGQQQL